MIINDTPLTIEKENISKLRFPLKEVLKSALEIGQRMADLHRGLLLGNIHKGKVKIIFEDGDSVRQVETTIWALTDTRVILKQGLGIPLCRIHKVMT
ncbi:MAG TPA: hypothetical protein VN922_02645 [Bacteroidia bacterium]|jgi:hypothetical protein|nr:hypothetical protein [Bacteroidia bacterium]